MGGDGLRVPHLSLPKHPLAGGFRLIHELFLAVQPPLDVYIARELVLPERQDRPKNAQDFAERVPALVRRGPPRRVESRHRAKT